MTKAWPFFACAVGLALIGLACSGDGDNEPTDANAMVSPIVRSIPPVWTQTPLPPATPVVSDVVEPRIRSSALEQGNAEPGTPKPDARVAGGTLSFSSPADGWWIAGTTRAGLGQVLAWSTHNGGETWAPIRDLAARYERLRLTAIDASHAWAVGTTRINCRDDRWCSDVLLSTTDSGATWTEYDFGDVEIRDVEFVSPTEGWMVIVFRGRGPLDASDTGRFVYTTDSGRTWRQFAGFTGDTWSQIQRFGRTTATQGSSVTFDGVNWEQVDVPCTRGGGVELEVGPSGKFWALCVSGCGGGNCSKYLYESLDRGAHWTPLAEHLWAPQTPTPNVGALPWGGSAHIMFLDDLNGWLTAGGHIPSLSRTRDGGRTWERLHPGQASPMANGRYMAPIGGYGVIDRGRGWAIVFSDLGVWQTDDFGDTWTPLLAPTFE